MAFDFDFTQDQLQQFLPKNPHVEHWFEALSAALPNYDITSAVRVAAFLGQTYVESAAYTAVQENLNYRAETLMRLFGRHFPGGLAEAQDYCSRPNKQEAIANRIYADRMGNGDEASGDGWAFCGRGLIQLTGRTNYSTFAKSIDTPMEDITEHLESFEGCVQSACWFWKTHDLNRFADEQDMQALTRVINGGELGLDERTAAFNRALQILGQ
jgi:putative chitinase